MNCRSTGFSIYNESMNNKHFKEACFLEATIVMDWWSAYIYIIRRIIKAINNHCSQIGMLTYWQNEFLPCGMF